MAIATPSFVQVAPDSTGKKIRNLEGVDVDPATGAESTVETQVTASAGPDGRLVNPDTTYTNWLLVQMLDELQKITRLLTELATPETRQGIVGHKGREFSLVGVTRSKK